MDRLNIVIVGHVDHGKSTLIGRLLYDSDSLPEGRVQEIQRLAEEYKKRFEFAYFLDAFDDEWKEERTIDTTAVMFKGKNLYTITDVPGHKEFVKNMLTGASHADVAVLVVAADEGIREQTRRHAFLMHMLGIKHIFVVVNKMDAAGYRREVFLDVKKEVTHLLGSFGYHDVEFIPASAMEGDNIFRKTERMQWHAGPTLVEALDRVVLHKDAKPLRFVVQDTYARGHEKITVGRVESGVIRRGEEVIFQPSGAKGRIISIRVFQGELERAEKGDSIGIITNCAPRRGDVCGLVESPPLPATAFVGELVLLEGSLRNGDVVEMKCGTRKVECEIEELRELVDSETGEVVSHFPASISEHDAAIIHFTAQPLVVERFSDIPELGRFVLVRGSNIGAGIVLETGR